MSKRIKNVYKDPDKVDVDESRHSLLVDAYIRATPLLQPRRTLDQYFYDGIDTTSRDTDQVVYRFCDKHNLEKKVFMVDQLWLWVLGNGEYILLASNLGLKADHIRFGCHMFPRTLGATQTRSTERGRRHHRGHEREDTAANIIGPRPSIADYKPVLGSV